MSSCSGDTKSDPTVGGKGVRRTVDYSRLGKLFSMPKNLSGGIRVCQYKLICAWRNQHESIAELFM